MKRVLSASVLLVVVVSAGCGSEKSECLVPAELLSDYNRHCWRNLGNGTCDDVARTPACSGTTLTCPAGYVLGDRCVCTRGGELPGCTCSAATGRVCQDAGTDATAGDASAGGHADAAIDGPLDAIPADAPVGVDAPPPDAAAATLSAAEFPAVAARVYCATLGPCCPGKSTAGCAAVVTAALADVLVKGAAVQNVFDPGKAAACVAAVRALGDKVKCVPWFMSNEPSLLPCTQTLDGVIPPGQECHEVAECRRGTANGTIEGGNVGCAAFDDVLPKRCRAFVPTTTPGTACEQGFHGQEPQVFKCAGGLVCQAGHCVTPPAPGQPCPDSICGRNAFCSDTRVCEMLSGDGEACGRGCQSELECNSGLKCGAPAPTPWILGVGFWAPGYTCE
jgi:hypothetical protein